MTAVGCDIEKISRFRNILKNREFLSNIYTDGELNYCFSKVRPEKYLARKFACKEAVFKALSSLGHDVPLKFIEIMNPARNSEAVKILSEPEGLRVHVSSSGAKNVVFASSVAERC